MIPQLHDKINKEKDKVNQWLKNKRKELEQKGSKLPIYTSFDLRDGGFKVAIVDSNLFPAGFNNIGSISRLNGIKGFKDYLGKHTKEKNILIVSESFTRNTYYLSNLCAIQSMLQKAGYTATIGTIMKEMQGETLTLEDSNGHSLTLEKMHRVGDIIQTKSFKDGLLLLNNDFSVQEPEILQNIKQDTIPPLKLGWAHRKKTTHFKCFDKLIDDFAATLKIDAWLLKTLHTEVDDIDFGEEDTLVRVAEAVEKLLKVIQKKYDEYKIKEKPYVFIKDNSGTYGLGILSVSSKEEVLSLNSAKRRKMLFGKQKTKITSVIIQEGIKTIYKMDNNPAEPVLYSAGGMMIGGFMRIHPEKDEAVSLSTPGMKFDMLLENKITKPLIDHIRDDADLSIYGIIGDIANIAIGHEYHEIGCGSQ